MKNINLKILLILLFIILITLITSKVFAKYTIETSEILILETNLDRTPPKLNISYFPKDIINDNVVVTIKSNEKIKNVDGWNISEDKMTLSKIYEENKIQDIEVFDLAGNKSIANIKIDNIDKVLPVVECIEIKNSNTDYKQYANNEKEINLTIKVSDNIGIKNVDLSKINIKVGSNIVIPTKVWTEKSSEEKEKIYNLKLTDIKSDGILKVIFESGFVTDISNNNSNEETINTEIIIDNTKPNIIYSQESITEGKIRAILTANEKVKKLNGWDISLNQKVLNKEFISNVSYELVITDLAGNETITIVNVTNATYISLVYASHNSNVGWTYGYGNYDVAGSSAVKQDQNYKTESLAFNVTGNVTSDFVRARAYVYTYWGEGAKARCWNSGLIYNHGYNPSSTSWKTMGSSDLVTINSKRCFQFGGSGINALNATDINGNNPIPSMPNFPFGICGISLALKDYKDYSIVYQIYIGNIGWLTAKSNGEETMYSKIKPMSAFRVSIIPNSEKTNLLNTWNEDVGKIIK